MLVTQSHPTLCNPKDCSLPDFSVHWILQARILEWLAIPFFREFSQLRDWTQVSFTIGRFFIIWAIRTDEKFWLCMSENIKVDSWKLYKINDFRYFAFHWEIKECQWCKSIYYNIWKDRHRFFKNPTQIKLKTNSDSHVRNVQKFSW